jgi:uncharacterized protein (DUF427 family)
MPKARWNNAILAETDSHEIVEGNVYFPLSSVKQEYLHPSDHSTFCHWKGTASYYHVEVDGKINENAAWYYPEPMDAASNILGHVAFWHGVEVERE